MCYIVILANSIFRNVTLLVGEVNFDGYVRQKPKALRDVSNDDKLD